MAGKTRLYVKAPTINEHVDADREFLRIEQAFDASSQFYATEVSHTAPSKPQELMVRAADGTNWDPGKGAGLYIYLGGIWNKIAFEP